MLAIEKKKGGGAEEVWPAHIAVDNHSILSALVLGIGGIEFPVSILDSQVLLERVGNLIDPVLQHLTVWDTT